MGRFRYLAPTLTVLLSLGLASCDKASPLAPEGTTLTISANPIIIPVNGVATVTVAARKPNGLPATQGTVIRFTTTIGQIEAAVTVDADGIARANLRGDGRAGKAKVTAATGSTEAVEVEVDIGSPGASVALLVTPTTIPQSGGVIQLQALVRDNQSQPVALAQVNFLSPLGRLGSGGLVVATDASGIARDSLTISSADVAAFSASTFEITVQVGGAEGAIVEDTAEINIGTPGASIALLVNPTSVPESGGLIQIQALVRDNLSRVLPGAQVNFLAPVGRLTSGGLVVFTDATGTARDSLSISAADVQSFPESSFEIVAQVNGSEGAVVEDRIEIQIGRPAASIVLTVDPSNIPENGGVVLLQARVRDGLSQPLPSARVTFLTRVGRLGSGGQLVSADAEGLAQDTLTVSAADVASYAGDSFEVTVQVGGAQGAIVDDTEEIDIGTPVGSLTLTSTPTNVALSGGDIALLAVVRSEQGRAIEGARVRFQTEVGSLQSGGSVVFTDADGEAVDTLRVSNSQLGSYTGATFTVTAQTTGRDGAVREDTQEIDVVRAASVDLQVNPATIPDTGGSLQLLAIVKNSAGVGVAGAPVNFGTDLGTLNSRGQILQTNSAGEARDTLRVTQTELATVPQGGTFQVRVSAGSTSDSFSVRISSNRPTADFTATLLGNFRVFFDNLTTGQPPFNYFWDFQSDGVVDNTTENPTFNYGTTGSFTVTLRAANSLGDDTAIKTIVVDR